MATYHTTLDVGQVLLIPAGSGASIELVEKSGRKAKLKITSNAPVTVTEARSAPKGAAPAMGLPRRPTPSVAPR